MTKDDVAKLGDPQVEYSDWEMSVRGLLRKKSVWEYVSGVIKCPIIIQTSVTSAIESQPTQADVSDNQRAIQDWLIKDGQAKGILIESASRSARVHVQHLDEVGTSQEMWLQWKGVYGRESAANQLLNLKALLKVEFNESTTAFIDKFQGLVNKSAGLMDANGNIKFETLCIGILLKVMPDRFNHVRLKITSDCGSDLTNLTKLSLKEVFGLMVSEDVRKDDGVLLETTPSDVVATFVAKPKKKVKRCDFPSCPQNWSHTTEHCRAKDRADKAAMQAELAKLKTELARKKSVGFANAVIDEHDEYEYDAQFVGSVVFEMNGASQDTIDSSDFYDTECINFECEVLPTFDNYMINHSSDADSPTGRFGNVATAMVTEYVGQAEVNSIQDTVDLETSTQATPYESVGALHDWELLSPSCYINVAGIIIALILLVDWLTSLRDSTLVQVHSIKSANSPIDNEAWLWDTGATTHCCRDLSLFIDYTQKRRMINSYGQQTLVEGIGTVYLRVLVNDQVVSLKLTNVLHVPSGQFNILSHSAIVDALSVIIREDSHGTIKLKSKLSGRYILEVLQVNKLYPIRLPNMETDHIKTSVATVCLTYDLAHLRLLHPGQNALNKLIKSKYIGLPQEVKKLDQLKDFCQPCLLGKLPRSPFHSSETVYHQKLEGVVSDLTFSNVRSLEGFTCVITFQDLYSRYLWIYPLKTKTEAIDRLKTWLPMVERQSGQKVKFVRTDGGGEYVNQEWQDYLGRSGIAIQKTTPYSSQSNGVAEKVNLTLWNMTRCSLAQFGTDSRLWSDAMEYAAFVKNRLPHEGNGSQVPFKLWTDIEPQYHMLRVLFCKAFPCVVGLKKKLDNRSQPAVFAGISTEHKAWKFYTPDLKKKFVSRDVKFIELQSGLPSAKTQQRSFADTESDDSDTESTPQSFQPISVFADEVQDPSDQVEEDQSTVPKIPVQVTHSSVVQKRLAKLQKELRIEGFGDQISLDNEVAKSLNTETTGLEDVIGIAKRSNMRSGGQSSVNLVSNFETSLDLIATEHQQSINVVLGPHTVDAQQLFEYINFSSSSAIQDELIGMVTVYKEMDQISEDPTSVKQALSRPDSALWLESIQSELAAHKANKSFELIDQSKVPVGANVLSSKFVFKTKFGQTGLPEVRKSRLCIRGFQQLQGIDYEETFAPVVRYVVVRLFLAMAVAFNWETCHIDIKTAFLNGKLDAPVYCKQPTGAEAPGKEECIMKLLKSIYGLKQSPRIWNHTLDKALVKLGFSRLSTDHSVYKITTKGKRYLLLVYVDDLALGGPKGLPFNKLKEQILSLFPSRDLGPISYFLGIQVTRVKGAIQLSQGVYIDQLVTRFGFEKLTPVTTPSDGKTTLSAIGTGENDQLFDDTTVYAQAVGALLHLSIATRPDISCSVGIVSRYIKAPRMSHWAAVKRIYAYLKSTKGYSLTYGSTLSGISGYCDADWAGDVDGSKSTSGYCFFLNNGLVSWASSLQTVVALSTVEAEYIALSNAIKELIYLQEVVYEIGQLDVEFKLLLEKSTIYEDNQGTIALVKNPVFPKRSKHIRIKYHFARDEIANGTAELVYVQSENNVADIMTKPLAKKTHSHLVKLLGLEPRLT